MATKTEQLKRIKAHTRYYTKDGNRVPGTTTITGVLAKPALKYWANNLGLDGIDVRNYVDKTAQIGTLGHYLIECELKGEEPDLEPFSAEMIDRAENCQIKFWTWLEGKDLKPILVEEPLVSERYRYGGTIDCYGMINGRPTLIDIKTSKKIYPEMFIQLAAYQYLLEENGHDVESVRILRIGRTEEEGFEEQVKGVTDLWQHWKIFEHLRAVYDLKKAIS